MGIEAIEHLVRSEAPVEDPGTEGDDQEAAEGAEAEPVTEEDVQDVPAAPEDDEE